MSLSRRACLAAAAAVAVGPGLTACSAPPLQALAPHEMPPPAPREFRGAWVASVANIDWPSAPGLPEAQLRAEIDAIVERAAALGLNALIVQVRPAADALYRSALEPTSEYLGGVQGAVLGSDPLALWIGAAHRRGIELHAWFNPFRARHPSARSPLAAGHVAVRQPGWARTYGDALWLDPGEPGAVAHTLAVVDDVVRRYDLDGVHIDDYFYPYPVKAADGSELPFPDDASYARSGSKLARDDWRRDNVDRFVQSLYQRVHAAKPWLKVGISPFALPRRVRRPAGIEGFDPHAKLYADAEHWLQQGWLDYICPQLYWPMAQRAQAFDVLLAHWAATNTQPQPRHLWPGLFTSRVALAPNPWPAEEIERQIAHLRAPASGAGGHVHFSMRALMDDRGGLASRLLAARPTTALVPASPWLGAQAPPPPRLEPRPGGAVLHSAEPAARWLVVWQRRAGVWRLSNHRATEAVDLPAHWPTDPAGAPLEAVVASTLGPSGVESERMALRLPTA